MNEDGSTDVVDFATDSPQMVSQWVDGLSMMLHTGSVGIGLEIKQTAGKFIVEFGRDGSPSGACGKFNHGDVIEAVDTHPLTEQTTFAEYEALILGPDGSPISLLLNRGGQKVTPPSFNPQSFISSIMPHVIAD
jgi:C-terminal processing protease CtpA/Prc